jgi:hypothetical protein
MIKRSIPLSPGPGAKTLFLCQRTYTLAQRFIIFFRESDLPGAEV